MVNLKAEIMVRIFQGTVSYAVLAQRRITIESEHPATIQIGAAVQDMLVAALLEARTEQEQDTEGEGDG